MQVCNTIYSKPPCAKPAMDANAIHSVYGVDSRHIRFQKLTIIRNLTTNRFANPLNRSERLPPMSIAMLRSTSGSTGSPLSVTLTPPNLSFSFYSITSAKEPPGLKGLAPLSNTREALTPQTLNRSVYSDAA